MSTRFRGRLDAVVGQLTERLLPLAGRFADEARASVVHVIESSTPAGRLYRHPRVGTYRASAPGQPPASPTGEYPASWGTTAPEVRGDRVRASAATDSGIGPRLEFGDPGPPVLEPRPHARPAVPIAAERIGRLIAEGVR